MSKQPKVSCIIAAKDRELTIGRALDSILSQTISDVEIIAINDFSQDNTLAILEDYESRDSRVKVINNEK